jgi:glutathione S-transferase
MIELYQLSWSHYVEKVQWALDYKGITWKAIDIDPFTKAEMRHLRCETKFSSSFSGYTVPTIYDTSTGLAVNDSSVILKYLEERYPKTARLFPGDQDASVEIYRWTVWLDSELGLAARRLGYTQVILEHPTLLAQLFLGRARGGLFMNPLLVRLASAYLGGILAKRFRFRRNRQDRVYEELERCLLIVARRMKNRSYLVGDRFTAADLTLASLLRPVRLVPFFRDHPALEALFEWQTRLFLEHGREPTSGYERSMENQRQRVGLARAVVPWLGRSLAPAGTDEANIPTLQVARNDQHPVSRWMLVIAPFTYLLLRYRSGIGTVEYTC